MIGQIATWTYRQGCPELRIPGGQRFTTRCPWCDAEWQDLNCFIQITGHWEGGKHMEACADCAKELTTWTEAERADIRLRTEAMIVRGIRHHGLTQREANMVRKKVDTLLAVQQFAPSTDEPEKLYLHKPSGEQRITPKWAKWDRERRQRESGAGARPPRPVKVKAEKPAPSYDAESGAKLVRNRPEWINGGDIPVRGGNGLTYGVADKGNAPSGRPFAPWIVVTSFPSFGEASEQIAVEIVNTRIRLVSEVVYSPEARLRPGWTPEQERLFADAVINRTEASEPGAKYEALWNPGQPSAFTAPHNAGTVRDDYNQFAAMDRSGECARLVAKGGEIEQTAA